MAAKTFKFRVDSNGSIGIKEVIYRKQIKDVSKINISMGLDSDLNLASTCIFKDGLLIPYKEQKGKKKTIYYSLNDLVYICMLTLVVSNRKIIKREITIYMPQDLRSETEFSCKRVTSSFSDEAQEQIIANLTTFALSRITL